MSQELYDRYFESIYKRKNILTPDQLKANSEHFSLIYGEILPADINAAILDLGCGTGSFLAYLRESGYHDHFGIDLSPQQIAYCHQAVTTKAVVADALIFLDKVTSKYDVIVANDLMEHIGKDALLPLLKKIHAALKPGGIFTCRVPNMSHPFAAHSRYGDLTHTIGLTEHSLYQVLFLAGFSDISFKGDLVFRKKTLRSLIRKLLVNSYQAYIRFLYYIQDFTVPGILDRNLIAVARKTIHENLPDQQS